MCKGQMSRMKTLFKLFCLSNEALASSGYNGNPQILHQSRSWVPRLVDEINDTKKKKKEKHKVHLKKN